MKQEFQIAAYTTELATKKVEGQRCYQSVQLVKTSPNKMHKQSELKRKQYKSKKLNKETNVQL
ncbi:hypothetical protein RM545_07865 [Zunongwangia sp. F260]|uniref:Ribosomal protein L33 n=1 Tax=Autumnicola lenta TaxID=3075593 RepID=A0ABU3CK46_9FLAO|nr:hypothetical protein [Zunongwangia sp. F260]MDT0646602.1 hypothetical protein [Zunongwangia sp. F260]